MNAQEAFQQLQAQKWSETSIIERLELLHQVRENLAQSATRLAKSDSSMKNKMMEENLFSDAMSMTATVVPIANTINSCIHLYESLAKGNMPKPIKTEQVDENLYDIMVFPQNNKDKFLYGSQKAFLRVKGKPKQIDPRKKPAGVIAILGAGNYSSSIEMVNAMFLENCAVIHKPHRLNKETDTIWEQIFEPLKKVSALSFCDADQGEQVTQLKNLTRIYFTGGADTASVIKNSTSTPLVPECGGNNPCIIVPGEKPWTDKEIQHQATQIATAAKMNGGAVCGRPQTLVTSKHWSQRKEFLEALKIAILETTPADGTYYPGSKQVKQVFLENCPEAELLEPEHGKYKNSEFLFISNVNKNSYSIKHEAFCQIIDEVPLDVVAKADEFLPKAVNFCNSTLLGTLGCAIIIDEDTKKTHNRTLKQAVKDLHYGAVAINTMPPFIWLNPYLTWGGDDQGRDIVSGLGNFGNALCFDNVQKSILYDNFLSSNHFMRTNKVAFDHLNENMTQFSLNPSWLNIGKMVGTAMIDGLRSKDF